MSHRALGGQWVVRVGGSHPQGGELATLIDEQGVPRGQMHFERNRISSAPGHTMVWHIAVDDSHRGQGGAQALYRGVHEETGEPFLHYRDQMTPVAKRAVAKSAAELPGAHREMAWRGGGPVVRAFPRVGKT